MNQALSMSSAFQHTTSTAQFFDIDSHSAFSRERTIIEGVFSSDWGKQLKQRFIELTSLQKGWDGYNGLPVSFHCAHFTANMLERLYNENVPAPSLIPGGDGSLQVEWHRNNYDVELDVLDIQKVVATRFNIINDEEEVIEIENDFTKVVDWITALSY